jgi:hypothetical protein
MTDLAVDDGKMHGRSYVFSTRMAGAASLSNEAVCPPLSNGGGGLAQQDGALFGLQIVSPGQISDVPVSARHRHTELATPTAGTCCMHWSSMEFPIEVVRSM